MTRRGGGRWYEWHQLYALCAYTPADGSQLSTIILLYSLFVSVIARPQSGYLGIAAACVDRSSAVSEDTSG